MDLSLLAFCAGATGLLYEIAFSRMLIPLLGNSPAASTATLAAFTVGLAIGSRLVGRWSDRARRPLHLFAALECMAAVLALVLPMLVASLSTPVAVLLAHGQSFGFASRFGIAFALLSLPGIAVGGTLPPLIRIAWEQGDAGLSKIYGANTLGAASGAALGGLLLLPWLGLRASCQLAAALDACIALCAFALSARARRERANAPPDPAPDALPAWMLLLLVACTGFATLALEVLWLRFLPFMLGNGLYLLPSLLAVVLLGLGAGALLDAMNPTRSIATRLFLTAISIPLCLRAAALLFLHVGAYVWLPFSSPVANQLLDRLVYLFAVVFIPSLALGTIFPAVARLRCRDGQAGRRFGGALAASALGLIAGALATPTLLIPIVGAEGMAQLVAVLLLIATALVARPRRFSYAGLAIVALALCLLPRDAIRRMLRHDSVELSLPYYHESATATVSVLRDRASGNQHLYVNAVGEVPDTIYGLQAFRMLGHLPYLLQTDPKRALMITFGGGIAAGTLLQHPLTRLDVVDLEPDVFEASRLFEHVNHRPLADPRLHRHVQDGRNYLLAHHGATQARYDLIVSDATHPGSGDSWVLYTQDFYQLCKASLAEQGLMVQWLPMHSMAPASYLSVVATLGSVFPYTSVWLLNEHSIIVGSQRPIHLDLHRLSRALSTPPVAADFSAVGLGDVESLLSTLVLGPSAVAEIARTARLATDDLPWTTADASGIHSLAEIAKGLLAVQAATNPLADFGITPTPELAERLACIARAAPALIDGDCALATSQCPASPKVRLCATAIRQPQP